MRSLTLFVPLLLITATSLRAEEVSPAVEARPATEASLPGAREGLAPPPAVGDSVPPATDAAPASAPAPAPVMAPVEPPPPPPIPPEPESRMATEVPPEVAADAAPPPPPVASPTRRDRMPVPGDCAIFREGGQGYILKAPTYWLKGTIVEIYRRPHRMDVCPDAGKPRAHYKREDWVRLAAAYPCVSDPARVADVEAIRVRLRVDDWDTPWSVQHGRNGWLMRGHFLDIELEEGRVVDIDGTLLEYCEESERSE